jgi:hypothetical protein
MGPRAIQENCWIQIPTELWPKWCVDWQLLGQGAARPKNYCSGWCQFVRSAKGPDGDVMVWDPTAGAKGLMVDVYLYMQDSRKRHQAIRLEQEQGKAQATDRRFAGRCLHF